MSIISVSLLAVERLSDFTPLFFAGVLEVLQSVLLKLNCTLGLLLKMISQLISYFFQAIVAALLMNIYIVGLNQLSDIEIDKVAHL